MITEEDEEGSLPSKSRYAGDCFVYSRDEKHGRNTVPFRAEVFHTLCPVQPHVSEIVQALPQDPARNERSSKTDRK